VSWQGPAGVESVQTEAPTAFVLELAQRFDGAEIPGLSVRRPSLEDVYLAMIDS
jgi:ABC-2 type transport system ATP-binding protein